MAVISFINLKGGVGKTTCCVALAEYLSGEHHRRVLVVDLDPQTNATTALIGAQRWQQVDEAGQTLRQMFLDQFVPREVRTFQIGRAIIPRASNVAQAQRNMWLLPSSLKLIGLEAVVEMIHAATDYQVEPYEVLAQYLTPSYQLTFDDILIDCPPSLNAITLNGLYLSDAYVIPVYPEPISGVGIYQIQERIGRLRSKFGRQIPALGILVNRLNRGSKHQEQERFISRLQAEPGFPDVFEHTVPERQSITLAMRNEVGADTLGQKYGETGTPPTHEAWLAVTKEFYDRCSTLTK